MTKFFSDAQLASEINKCEFCEEKTCKKACPVGCSPTDFIMAAKLGKKVDYYRAASLIMSKNPLGGVCGAICPEKHCMSGCVHKDFDTAINIPMIQASIIERAKELNKLPFFKPHSELNIKIAIIGSGPAGLGAAAVLAQDGYKVTIFEKESLAGGACNLIPDIRLDKKVLKTDIEFISQMGSIDFRFNEKNITTEWCLNNGFSAVIVCTGLDTSLKLGIDGEENTIIWSDFLHNSFDKSRINNCNVAIIGGGAVAVDCSILARLCNAKNIDIICIENNSNMPLTQHERNLLLINNIGIISKTTITSISKQNNNLLDLNAAKIDLPKKAIFNSNYILPNTNHTLKNYNIVIKAIGNKSTFNIENNKKVFYAGDIINGATTVVEAVASGKNTANLLKAYLNKKEYKIVKKTRCDHKLFGYVDLPISLETDFFGRKILSPFILSAAPSSDGYDNMKKAYESGWAGGVMKTAFDNVPIHIPSEYMFVYNSDTYANCDNVSGHSLDRMCNEISKLVKKYPDRLTIGSTGGPVTGDDINDKYHWQSNTLKLEKSGAMGIEYSLSCPQGGDGTEGDIVSQNAKLTAKIINWIMEIGDPNIPKLFKLTAAVTSIYPIIDAIRGVLNKYPEKKAGITLANSFPTLVFRKNESTVWEKGVIAGMSGDGVKNISYLTLANAIPLGVTISGNGGPMDYKAAADFLALGVNTVQFCTIVLKYGLGIIDHLHSGLSYLMQERGIHSVKELIGCAFPKPITEFMQLDSLKKIPYVDKDLCQHCGNCTRCPYLAITLDNNKIPVIDPKNCIGCSLCTQRCFAKALHMRQRTSLELDLLSE